MRKTVAAIRAWLDKTVRVKEVLPAYILLVAGITAGLWQFDQQAEDRLTVLSEERERVEFITCRQIVEEHNSLTLAFDALLNEFSSDTTTRIREILEEAYPPRSVEEVCGESHQ